MRLQLRSIAPPRRRPHVLWLPVLLLLHYVSLAGAASDHGVILLYHHVSESTPPSTSVSPARFQEHLDYLQKNDYRVLPLQDLLQALLSGKSVPDRAVAITFDDAYISVYSEAAPRLHRLGWPFTVFVASDPVDEKLVNYMSWDQLRELLKLGGSIGAHSASHAHLVRHEEGESESRWHQRISNEIDKNVARILEQTGVRPESFAYPFGEYNDSIKRMVGKRDMFGLAQQSGAVGRHTNPLQIPRFPLATGLDDMARFRTAIDSRPLPVREEHVSRTLLHGQLLILELETAAYAAERVRCYSAAGESLESRLSRQMSLHVTLPPTRPGRNKVNCTAPAADSSGEFYWHSFLWMGE